MDNYALSNYWVFIFFKYLKNIRNYGFCNHKVALHFHKKYEKKIPNCWWLRSCIRFPKNFWEVFWNHDNWEVTLKFSKISERLPQNGGNWEAMLIFIKISIMSGNFFVYLYIYLHCVCLCFCLFQQIHKWKCGKARKLLLS